MEYFRIVLLGPPGCGKGTQAERLSAHLRVAAIATGDLFRHEISTGTELGRLASQYTAAGNLVPTEITNAMVRARLEQPDTEGFILDGYPRTVHQAEALDVELTHLGRELTAALFIDVPDEAIVDRVLGRRLCPADGAIYHVKFSPPQVDGKCDHCEGELAHRKDDTEETVRHRLEVYHRQTEPLRRYYTERGILRAVDGAGTPEEIFGELLRVVTEAV